MRKLIPLLLIALAVFSMVACASKPATPTMQDPSVPVFPPRILEHPGTAWGQNPPAWIMNYVSGGRRAVERMPEFQDKFIVVVEAEGESRQGAELVAGRLNVQTRISAMMSTRVQDRFAGAQVGDQDMLETYMERVVKSVSEATFTGFMEEETTWVLMQLFDQTTGQASRQVYRVYQLWTINADLLTRQMNTILEGAAAEEPKTPEKERAIQAVQNAFYEGF